MKTRLFFLCLFLLPFFSFSQNNIGFESGTTAGWVCKSGYYGSVSDSCLIGSCPRYRTSLTCLGQLNANGINAPLNSATDRHVIVTGPGTDPNSAASYLVPVVAPGGGNYSFRLGNANVGSISSICGGSGGSYAQAEATRLSFPVTKQNASFTYRYAFFVQNPGHSIEGQPSFEAVVLDQNENIIPCGRYFVIAGNYPSCNITGGFINGSNGYIFKNWANVGLDLSAYIGQNISIEFRTTDCISNSGCGATSCANNICTFCCSGYCCTYIQGGTQCNPIPPGKCPGNSAGTHSAYAYLDAYAGPLEISAPAFCTGAASVQLCAPAGYVSYSWPAGQPGLSGSPTTQCVTISNPVAGKTYTVNMVSATGCPTSLTTTLQASVQANSTTICTGDSTTLFATGGSSYSWSTGNTTSSIIVTPSVTTTYTVTANTGTCISTATPTVTVGNSMPVVINSPPCTYPGGSITLSTSGGGTYLWSTGETTSAIVVAPTSSASYSVVVSKGTCSGSDTAYVAVTPLPVITANNITICSGRSGTLCASGAGAGGTYLWNPSGQTTSCIGVNASSPLSYMVVGTNASGCSNTAAATLTVLSSPPIPSISTNMSTFTSSSTTGNQWYLGGNPISGATMQTYTAPQNGIYTVCVTNANGCSACSLPNYFNTSGIIEQSNEINVSVFPNPSYGLFTIKSDKRISEIEIMDVLGQVIYSDASSFLEKEIDLHKQGKGIYFIKIKSEENFLRMEKVILQ